MGVRVGVGVVDDSSAQRENNNKHVSLWSAVGERAMLCSAPLALNTLFCSGKLTFPQDSQLIASMD